MLGRRLRSAAAVVTAASSVVAGVGLVTGVAAGDGPRVQLTTRMGPLKQGPEQSGPAWIAWLTKYGQFEKSMPMYPDVNAATPAQQSAAMDLLTKSEAGTAAYADLDKAKAAGYDLDASLAQWEGWYPWFRNRMQKIDAGQPAQMAMLHVANVNPNTVPFDTTTPPALMYTYQGNNKWDLSGVVYSANGVYPEPPPVPGGPITRWHYHGFGKLGLMMHVFFVPGNDLSQAFAMHMSEMGM